MNRFALMFVKFAAAVSLVGMAASTSGCYAEVAGPPVAYPPDSYIVGVQPVYYEGHASYFYGNRWYYRDGGRWSYYHSEPDYLRQRRGYATARGRVYEHRR